MRTLDLIITFDTEDVFNPAEAGRDGVIKELADILSAEGVPANFLFIASRAALLRERGRNDVIAAAKRHCVGVHTLAHDQPVATVKVAELSWEDGLSVCREMEGEAFRIVADVFDCQPVCLSSHHICEAPQNYVVARELGVPYVCGAPLAPPLFNISRVGDVLNFPNLSPYLDSAEPFLPYFDGFDDALSNEPDFIAHLDRFDRHIGACLSAKQPALVIHPCHPVKTYTLEWIDNFLTPNGVNVAPEERTRRPGPGLRTAGQMELAMRNFRRLARFIRKHPQLNVLTVPEAAAKYGRLPERLSRADLFGAAQRICATEQVLIDTYFSPAEVLMGLAEALTLYGREGALPESLPRSAVLGPMEDPVMIPEERGDLGSSVLLQMASDLTDSAKKTGYLPANLALPGGARIGLGSLYRALAEAYLVTHRDGRPADTIRLKLFDRQPRVGSAIGRCYTTVAESPLVVPNLSIDRLYRMGKLQSWTLAPAWYPSTGN